MTSCLEPCERIFDWFLQEQFYSSLKKNVISICRLDSMSTIGAKASCQITKSNHTSCVTIGVGYMRLRHKSDKLTTCIWACFNVSVMLGHSEIHQVSGFQRGNIDTMGHRLKSSGLPSSNFLFLRLVVNGNSQSCYYVRGVVDIYLPRVSLVEGSQPPQIFGYVMINDSTEI